MDTVLKGYPFQLLGIFKLGFDATGGKLLFIFN